MKGWYKLISIITALLVIPAAVWAEGPPKPSSMSNSLAQTLMVIIAALLLVIAALGYVVISAAKVNLRRYREERKKNDSNAIGKTLVVLILCCMGTAVFAEEATPEKAAAVDAGIAGLSSSIFYSLLSVIAFEFIIILGLLYNLRSLLVEEITTNVAGETIKKKSSFSEWWDNINKFKPIKEEAKIDLGHDYDGIRELDNKLPPWWLYGFYATILFACIYLWRHEVSHTAPTGVEEYAIAMEKAAVQQEAYLKKSANNIDETNVKLLTDPAGLEAAKKIFTTTCAACHAVDGGGGAGPNLTDDYWLHGGSVKDIFKTIKYGWPDKGMRSWKDDYSPLQIAQLASYVKSLHGSKPANPKEAQGEIFKDVPFADSTGAKTPAASTDSTKK
ncbi:cbb3-type cytochrome c oxidase N-terminal domain-containing protein [Chitinophagaceae bacterium LWZ2-11]